MLLSVTLAMAQPEIADSKWRDDDRAWGIHRMKITQNMAGPLNNWDLAEQPLTERHKVGICPWTCSQELLLISSREGVCEGDIDCFLYVSTHLMVLKEWQGREPSFFFFFPELWPSGYDKHRQLEIITTPFLLSSRSWHAEIWACGLVFGSPAGVFWVPPWKEIWPQNSTADIQAGWMISR